MINLDSTIEDIKKELGEHKFNHIVEIYNYIRNSKNISDVFKTDYLQKKEIDKYFIIEFLEKEKNYNLEGSFCDMACDDVISNINDGYSSFLFL